MRNNEERTGAREAHEAPPQVASPDEAPLSFVVPTEFVELPSKGLFYPENHPLHKEECVEIKFMTAKEEDILTSRTLLKKGLAIERLISSLLVDKRIKSQDLLVGDRNAILVAARVSGYGPDYNATVTCPSCAATQKHNFNLQENDLSGFLADENLLEITGATFNEETTTFSYVLPKTKVTVELKLMNGHDERRLADSSEKKRRAKKEENVLTDQFKSYIVAVNGERSPQVIAQFINSMPVLDSRDLRTLYNNLVPNVDMSQNFVCSSCDYSETMEVPFSAEFFWPK